MSNTSSSVFQGRDMLITGGHFLQQTNNFLRETHFELLQKRVSSAAMHDSGESFEKPKCHPNTRVAVLRRLTDWILGDCEQDKSIMWLYGDAGAGKSAIAQTLAQQCSSTGHLLASFAFSRNDKTRSTHTSLAPTIAYQMCTTVPELRTVIAAGVEQDPIVFDKSLEVQFRSLILNPLNDLSHRPNSIPGSFPFFLIIDGLDECSDHRIQIRIIEVLVEAVKQCDLKLKVLVASRPEIDISMAFKHEPIASLSSRLALDASFKPDHDIRLVLETTFSDIKAKHGASRSIPPAWPDDDIVTQLVRKASGQFIYASTVVDYISSSRHHPVERLEIVLGIQPPTSNQDLPFSTLDSLFTHIFSSIPTEYIEAAMNILGFRMYAPVLGIHFEPECVLPVLSLDKCKVGLYLGDLASIFEWTKYNGELETLEFTHASVTDFLSDRQRSGKFYVDEVAFRSKLACACLGHLNSPTNDMSSLLFSCYNLKYLMGNLTPALRDCLMSFSLAKMHKNIPVIFAFEFMHTLREKLDVQDIYVHHFADFDQYILSFMKKEKMRPNRDETLQTAIIGLEHDPSRVEGLTVTGVWYNSVFERDFLSCSQEKEGVLVDFFDNPLRSREFVRTGATYAAAVLAGFNEIFSEDWLRYLRLETKSLDDSTRSGHLFISFFNTACHYLPKLLDRASHSPELITCIQSGRFQSTYGQGVFPEKYSSASHLYNRALIVQVVEAAEAYLERVAGPIPTMKKWATRKFGWG